MKVLSPIFALVAVVAVGVAAAAPLRPASEAIRTATTCGPGGHLPKVGNVLDVNGSAYQGGRRLASGAALFTNAALCTSTGRTAGTLTFAVEKAKRMRCEMRRGARLRLFPPKTPPSQKQVVIRFEDGTTYCATAGGRSVVYRARNGGWVRLYLDDPLFMVHASPSRTVIKVDLGYVGVAGGPDGAFVIVGPGQQTVVPRLRAAQPVVAARTTAEDAAAYARLRHIVPPARLGRPAAAGSPVLERMFASGAISTTLVGSRGTGSYAFWSRFLAFLARSWGLDKVSVRSGLGRRASESVDIVGTRDATSGTRRTALPLFSDPRGTVWYLSFGPDRVARAAFRAFVRSAVTSGDYSAMYRDAFGREPSLDVLKPVLFG